MGKLTFKDILKPGAVLTPRKISKKEMDKWVSEIKQKQQECLDMAKIKDYDLLRRPMDI